MNKQPNTNSSAGVRFANENDCKIMASKIYDKIMQNIRSESIYGFADNKNDEYAFDEGYALTDDDHYDIEELNESFYFPAPKTVCKKSNDVAPICIVKVRTIGGVLMDKPLLCLLDTGSTTTMIQRRALPKGCNPMQYKRAVITMTANGRFDTSHSVCLKSIILLEFVNGREVDDVKEARLFDSPHCWYNIIFG